MILDFHPWLSGVMETYGIGATNKESVSWDEWRLDLLIVEEIVDGGVCLLLVSPFAFPHSFDRVAFVSEGRLGTTDYSTVYIFYAAVEDLFTGSVGILVAFRAVVPKTSITFVDSTAGCMVAVHGVPFPGTAYSPSLLACWI